MKSRKVKAYKKKLSTIPLEQSGSEEDFKDEESSDDNRDIEVEDSSDVEEVLPITDDEESEEEEDDEDLPKLDNWGKRKGIYYNADFVDQDRGKSYREEDAQKENEEREAGALQLEQLMCSHLRSLEFSKNCREQKVSKEHQNRIDDEDSNDSEKDEESDWQKLEHEKKMGPKVMELREEYETKLEEINSRLAPLIRLESTLNLDKKFAFYIKLKYQIVHHYMLNISFYLYLKNKGNVPTNHPVIEWIDKFKKLDDEFNSKKNYQKEIDFLIRELHYKDPSLLAKELSDIRSKLAETTKTKILKQKKSVTIQDQEEMELDTDENNTTVENSEEKRKITYQIAKNKGLKQRRNKRYRNPRVNNKIKFKKACIRRKGQVRQVVKEMSRYAGEFTGISSHVIRSVKFK